MNTIVNNDIDIDLVQLSWGTDTLLQQEPCYQSGEAEEKGYPIFMTHWCVYGATS
jgi:hypothetical protein